MSTKVRFRNETKRKNERRFSFRLDFCVGDRYFLYNNQILCEDDHERTRKALLASSNDEVTVFSK